MSTKEFIFGFRRKIINVIKFPLNSGATASSIFSPSFHGISAQTGKTNRNNENRIANILDLALASSSSVARSVLGARRALECGPQTTDEKSKELRSEPPHRRGKRAAIYFKARREQSSFLTKMNFDEKESSARRRRRVKTERERFHSFDLKSTLQPHSRRETHFCRYR